MFVFWGFGYVCGHVPGDTFGIFMRFIICVVIGQAYLNSKIRKSKYLLNAKQSQVNPQDIDQ